MSNFVEVIDASDARRLIEQALDTDRLAHENSKPCVRIASIDLCVFYEVVDDGGELKRGLTPIFIRLTERQLRELIGERIGRA